MAYRRRSTRRRPVTRRPVRRRRQTMRAPRRRMARPTRAKQQPCVCPGELTPTAKFALAQLDPFEPRALGAKVPDSNSIPSLANADTDQVSIPTIAGQNIRAMAFWPTYTDAVLLSGYITATPNVLEWGQTATAGLTVATLSDRRNTTNVVAAIEGIRPVAHAIRISSSLASTTATGFVHVGLATESRLTTVSGQWELPRTVAEMTGLAYYKRFTISSLTQSPITVINKWIDDTAFRYNTPTSRNIPTTTGGSMNSFEFGGSWGQLVVFLEGAPASTTSVVSIEHILLSELLPKKDSFILGTTAAPNSPPTMGAVGAMVSEQDFAHTEDDQDTYMQRGVDALKRGAAAQGERVFEQVALPIAERVGQGMVNYGMSLAMGYVASRGIPGVNANPQRLALN